MLGFFFRALLDTFCFFSGTGSGFFSTGFLSEKLLESVKQISLDQPFVDNQVPITGSNKEKKKHAFANFHSKLHAEVSIGQMDVTAAGQAEEENVYKFTCHKEGNKMMDRCNDQQC